MHSKDVNWNIIEIKNNWSFQFSQVYYPLIIFFSHSPLCFTFLTQHTIIWHQTSLNSSLPQENSATPNGWKKTKSVFTPPGERISAPTTSTQTLHPPWAEPAGQTDSSDNSTTPKPAFSTTPVKYLQNSVIKTCISTASVKYLKNTGIYLIC